MSNVISGVFAYAKVAEPAKKYQSEDTEFSIDIIVDKATYKAFCRQFVKQKGKTVDNDDFESIYKIPVPFPDQDEQYVLKLKKAATYKDGTQLPKQYWPKLLQAVNGKAVPIPEGVLLANGSKGKVAYDVTENSYGTFAKLKSILVEQLIEYKKAGGDPGADFGLETDYGASDFQQEEKQSESVPAKPAKPKTKPTPVVDDDDSDMSPF